MQKKNPTPAVTNKDQTIKNKYYRNEAKSAGSQTELNRNALGASLQTSPES